MKKLLLSLLLLIGAVALADSIEDPISTEGWLVQVLNFVSSMKGLTSLGIAAGVAQLVVGLGKTPLAQVAGKWRLVIVSVVSVVALVLANLATGQSLSAALATGPVLAAVQVFVHQIWKQLLTPAGNVPPALG